MNILLPCVHSFPLFGLKIFVGLWHSSPNHCNLDLVISMHGTRMNLFIYIEAIHYWKLVLHTLVYQSISCHLCGFLYSVQVFYQTLGHEHWSLLTKCFILFGLYDQLVVQTFKISCLSHYVFIYLSKPFIYNFDSYICSYFY